MARRLESHELERLTTNSSDEKRSTGRFCLQFSIAGAMII
jgi:hypothetical protein